MKTNKLFLAAMATTAIMAISMWSVSAMWGWEGGWNWFGKTLTTEQKEELKAMSQEDREAYVTKLKEESWFTWGKWKWKGGKGNHNVGDMISDIPSSDLSAVELEILSYGSSEERLARDVYSYMYDLYGSKIFDKISASEQKHMDAVEVLLDRYEIDAPTWYGELDSLYNDLIEEGKKWLKEALEVGLKIEALDIRDIDKAISETDNDDFKVVFINIGWASYNHMKAFLNELNKNGFTTDIDTSEFLSEDELSLKGPLKYKLAERMEAQGIELPEQVSSETLKAKWPKKWDSHGKKGSKKKGANLEKKGEYKKAIKDKYQEKINALDNDKLEEVIVKIDALIEKINTGSYSDATKEKYNITLIALKEVILEKIEGEEINIDGLFD